MTHHYTLDQLSLLGNIGRWYSTTDNRNQTFVITRQHDPWYMQNVSPSHVWICGYAKSAKALVQTGVLVDYHASEYGLTDYGVKELARLGLIEMAVTR